MAIRHYDKASYANHIQGELTVLPVRCPEEVVPSRPSVKNAGFVLDCLNEAINGCLAGDYSAMVTGPVNKAIINEAGTAFTGHTEYIADRCGSYPVMMLMNNTFRIALITTHLPLSRVPQSITPELIEKVITIVDQDMRDRFGITAPKILVCGLNPHAGEQGYLGNEEQQVIEPVVTQLKHKGLEIQGPVSADTAFTSKSLDAVDVIICMYHDQGLPVLKATGFGNIVNVTLGLPIIRTSVDHGTAFDLAGTSKADSSSLVAAVHCALELVKQSNQSMGN